jgi:hypothetical protein
MLKMRYQVNSELQERNGTEIARFWERDGLCRLGNGNRKMKIKQGKGIWQKQERILSFLNVELIQKPFYLTLG